MSVWGRVYLAAMLGFLYLPIAVMAALSFNASPLYQLPPQWSLTWYRQLADNDKLIGAALNSLGVAALTTVIATALGAAAALALYRYDFPGKRLLTVLLLPPIAIPWLIIGTAMLIFFFWIGIGRGLHAMVLGHVALALALCDHRRLGPAARFRPAPDRRRPLAGRKPLAGTAPRHPALSTCPGWLTAAALFAFAVSFDQFVISYFLAVPGVSTLPVEIYTAIRKGFTPEVNAVSTDRDRGLDGGAARCRPPVYRFAGEGLNADGTGRGCRAGEQRRITVSSGR